MADARSLITQRLRDAFGRVEPGVDPQLRPSDHADFQANGALSLAKRLGRDPVELAGEIVDDAILDDVCERVEISGPGFINLTLSEGFLGAALAEMAADERLGVPSVTEARTVLVDYSAPNVAKEMHVGNLRSTIIGDALCRLLEHLGHHVLRENHIGDWGTPFGMLIEHLVDLGEEEAAHELSVGDLNRFYQEARISFDGDGGFRERSRRRVV
ncbi:MAG: arginine--tRNA ligase domain-containing protein, partial [Acidimicrobiales bacterium]